MAEKSMSLTMVGVAPSCLGGIATLVRELCTRIETNDNVDLLEISFVRQFI